jgi:hypothetical protein
MCDESVPEDPPGCASRETERRKRSTGAARPLSSRLSRRAVLRSIAAGAGLAALPAAGSTGDAAPGYWTVVVLPDTQMYAENQNWTPYASDQTRWIVENLGAENIRFVTHEGDVVENGDEEAEWERMDEVVSTLDAEVPYSVLPGNHDWAVEGDRTSSSENFRRYFGADRYADRDWFGGAGPASEPLNFYQYFTGGGYEFLHLALGMEPPGDVDDPSTSLGWAQDVLDRHRFHPTILTTHSHLNERRRTSNLHEYNDIGNTGQEVWEKLVSPNPQVFMVLNGHHHDHDGENHQVSTNGADLPVYEVLADYQDYADGGSGYLRLVQFRPGGGDGESDRIEFVTYSPSRDEYLDDDASNFAFDLDFDDRFDPASWVGDVDGDGDLDGDDVTRLQEHLAGRDVDVDEGAADVNGDGRVDVADAVALNEHVGGTGE